MTTFDRDFEHVLTLEQEITGATLDSLIQELEDLLAIEQSISVSVTRERTVSHELILRQAFDYSSTGADTYAYAASVSHDLDIVQEIDCAWVYDFSVTHVLNINQDIGQFGIHFQSIVHELFIEQEISYDPDILLIVYAIEHELAIEQWVTGDGKTLFTDAQMPTRTVGREVEHELNLTQYVSVFGTLSVAGGYEVNALPKYQPQTPAIVPVVVPASTTTFEYPPTSPTHTVTLRSPLFSNQEEIAPIRIQRKTRGGKLITFADNSWVGIRIFRMKFDSLTDQQRIDFFDFLAASLGRPIKFTDHEGQEWTGVITNPDGEASMFNRLCGNTAEFNFETVINVE